MKNNEEAKNFTYPKMKSFAWSLCPGFGTVRSELWIDKHSTLGVALVAKYAGAESVQLQSTRLRGEWRHYLEKKGESFYDSYMSVSYSSANNLGVSLGMNLGSSFIVNPYIGAYTNINRPGIQGYAGIRLECDFC